MAALVESLRRRGVIQPIVVRRMPGGRFQVIAGERRWRAAREAGLAQVPVVVRQAGEDEALEVSLIENLQREDLNPMDAANAYARLVEDHGYSQDRVATALGRSRPAIANTMRLLSLPETVQQMVADQTLSEGHARAVLTAEGPARQIQVAREAVKQGLSVRATEKLARTAAEPGRSQGPGASKAPTSPEIHDLEEQLQRALSARVRILHRKAGNGEMRVRYSSLDELDSILDTMLGKRRR